jgi:hypothetical protein
MDEEELKRLSGRTFGSSPTFPSNMFANAAKTPAYDTQTRKLVGSDFSPSRQPDGKPISMAIPSFTAPLPTGLSPAAVGQNLVTQPQSAISSTNPTVPDFPIEGMGLMGNQNIRPLPTEQISPMTRFEPTLEDRGKITTDIVGMQGKTPMQTPYGTVYATAGQMGSERVSEMGGLPAQSARLENIGERARQSAAVKQMRERGAALNQERTDWVQSTIDQRRANPTTYTTPSGSSAAVPTNRFGEPIKAWMDQLGNEGRLNYGPRPATQTTASLQPRYGSITQPSQYPRREENATAPQQTTPSPLNNSVLASTGFGAMQRAQQESMPQAIGRSPLFAGMGYMAAFGGGPQPAGSMMAYNNQEDARTRFRRTLGLV